MLSVVAVASAAIAMPQLPLPVPAGVPVESAAWAVKVKLPAAAGVPLMAPLAAAKVSPGGNDPAVIENVKGGIPPDAVSAEKYGAPTRPALAAQAIVTGAGAMAMPQVLVAVPAGVPVESATSTV